MINFHDLTEQFKIVYMRLKRHRISKTKAFVKAFMFHVVQLYSNKNKLQSNINVPDVEELVTSIRNSKRPKMFIDFVEKDVCLNVIADEDKVNILSEADDIVDKKFRLLGRSVTFMGEIDWHTDFNSGYRWPLKYHKRLLPVFNVTDDSDGKVPYELSRFNHLSALGRAYWLTGNQKYADEFVCEVEGWIEQNPFPLGVNWTCAMDVSIRVCNLLLGFSFFKDSRGINDEFICKLTETFLHHGNFIMDNLEFAGQSKLTTNHYLSDIAGLIYLGILVPQLKSANKWRDFGIQELIKEMDKQVYDDGSDFEGSTCYHRLVLELFFFSSLVVIVNDNEFNGTNYADICMKKFGKEYTEKLCKMFEVVLHLLKPNGRMPQIGDNDNGRLHVFSETEVLDMRYLLALGAVFFSESRFKVREYGFSDDVIWVFGRSGYIAWNSLDDSSIEKIGSRAFLKNGWFVLRHNRDYCLVSCGPNGGDGWHSHNDKLSIELMIDGKDIIVDPGTYVYTACPEQRNKFRSTEYHNTVVFNGYEQNDIPEKVMFSLPDSVNISNSNLHEKEDSIVFEGEIQYSDFFHSRKIALNKSTHRWKIDDIFTGPKMTQAKLMFHLSPNVAYEAGCLSARDSNEHIASIEVEGLELTKTAYEYSPAYGVKAEAESLTAHIPVSGNKQRVTTTIARM